MLNNYYACLGGKFVKVAEFSAYDNYLNFSKGQQIKWQGLVIFIY